VKYCNQCGSAQIKQTIPEGDNRARWVCFSCQQIYYQNPKVVAGCLLYWKNRVLLAKRAIEPRYAYWTLPAGYMEMGETTSQAAARESMEEAQAKARNLTLYGMISLPYIGQVYVMYYGELDEGRYGVGEESLEVELFAEDEIPWKQLAFPIVTYTLKKYFTQVKEKQLTVFDHVIDNPPAWRKA